jgi:hypothetical protein
MLARVDFIVDRYRPACLLSPNKTIPDYLGAGDLWFEARVKFSTITTTNRLVCRLPVSSLSLQPSRDGNSDLANVNLLSSTNPKPIPRFNASYKADGFRRLNQLRIGTLAVDTYVKWA